MFQLSSIVSDLVKNITWLSPVQFKIVNTYERGIRFSMGKNPTLLEPGMHFYLQWLQKVTVKTVTPDVTETHFQTVKTKDDKELTVSVGFMFEIVDLVKYTTTIDDFMVSLENLAQTFIAREISNRTYQEFMDRRMEIIAALETALKAKVEEWGVHISNLGFINVSSASAFRLMYDSAGGASNIDELVEAKLRRDMHME